MEAETEKLILKVLKTDKQELERRARAEGEPVSVIVRRYLRAALRASDASQPTQPDQPQPQPAPAPEVRRVTI